MNAVNAAAHTAESLADPTIDAASLATIAAARPDLRAAILAHPNCYPGLTTWIHQQQNPSAAPQVVAPQVVAPQVVAPGAAPYAQQPYAQQPYGTQSAGTVKTIYPLHFIAPIAAFVAIISLFMPQISLGGLVNVNYFTGPAAAVGIFFLLLLLVVLSLGAAGAMTGKPGLRIAGGVVGIIICLFTMIAAFANIASGSSIGYGASPGIGAILLALSSIAVFVFSIVTLATSKK